MISRLFGVLAAVSLVATVYMTASSAEARSRNIVDTAASTGQFTILIKAAKAAGLAGVLSTKRNLTVFAPTDAAFAQLGKGTLNTLLKPRNREKLRNILLYHVLGLRVTAGHIPAGRTHVRTLSGKAVAVRKNAHGVRVNRSRVIKADVIASNGVVHAINRVLIP